MFIFRFFEKMVHQNSSKNHEQLIKIAFRGLWEYQRMIPHVVFLLRGGLKAYSGWITQVLMSKHVPKRCKKTWEFQKQTYKRGHLYSAAGAFSQKKSSTNHEKYEIFQKIMNKCHIFFAAGAFSQQKKSMNNMIISKKKI